MSRLRAWSLALIGALAMTAPFVALAVGPNNPVGDIQPFGGASSGGNVPVFNPNSGASPKGNAAGNVDWKGYSQSDSTGPIKLQGNVLMGIDPNSIATSQGGIVLPNNQAGVFQSGQPTPQFAPLAFGAMGNANSVVLIRPNAPTTPSLQLVAGDGSVGADLNFHRFLVSNDQNLPQMASAAFPTTGINFATGQDRLIIKSAGADTLTVDGNRNITTNGTTQTQGLVTVNGFLALPNAASTSTSNIRLGPNDATGVKIFRNAAGLITFGLADLSGNATVGCGKLQFTNNITGPNMTAAYQPLYGIRVDNPGPYVAMSANNGSGTSVDYLRVGSGGNVQVISPGTLRANPPVLVQTTSVASTSNTSGQTYSYTTAGLTHTLHAPVLGDLLRIANNSGGAFTLAIPAGVTVRGIGASDKVGATTAALTANGTIMLQAVSTTLYVVFGLTGTWT